MQVNTDNTVEFFRPEAVDRLPPRGARREIEADAIERAALARRLGLQQVLTLTASVELEPLTGGTLVRVKGQFRAEVVQTCVVSLEPVPATVVDEFELMFAPSEAALDEEGEIELSWDEQDPPDLIVNGVIDIGEVVSEHLSLALDPFPRSPGAAFELPPEPPDVSEKKLSPFAGLAVLRQKKE